MLTRVEFENYRAFKKAAIDLGALTLIVGPNASGKSSVLTGISRFVPMLKQSLLTLQPEDWRSVNGASFLPRVLCRVGICQSGSALEQVDVQFGTALQLGVFHSVSCRGRFSPNANIDFFRVDHAVGASSWVLGEPVPGSRAALAALPPAYLLRLNPAALGLATDTDMLPHLADWTGEGLPALLADLAINHADKYRELADAMKAVVPSFVSVRLLTVPSARTRELIFDFTNSVDLRTSEVSEGTLVALGILAAAFWARGPQVLLIDELERGLHPRALGELAAMLRKIADRVPGLQIVATTHSPYLVDHFRYDEIRMTSLLPNGSATIARLDQHPDFDRWKDEMLPGEFWSTTGEKWIAERQAKQNGA